MRWLARNHRRIFVGVVAMLLIAIASFANAFQLCWQAPTENVDGTPVNTFDIFGNRTGGLVYFTAYYGQEQAGQWNRTMRIDQTGDGCVNIRASRGIWYAAMTATNMQGETSALSNWVQKEENRLAGPRGGGLVGPRGGRLLD